MALHPRSTSVISSDVVQVLLLVSFDTFFINQLPDELEARIIPDYLGPDFRKQLKHHPPLLTCIKIHDRRFDRLELHDPRSLPLEPSHQASVKISWRWPFPCKSDKADNTKIIENQLILLREPTIFSDFYLLDGLLDS
jgi:hypothetical protein